MLSLTSQNVKKAEEEISRANETLEDKVLVRTRELTESEAKYRGLFGTMDEAFYISHLLYDLEGSIIDWIYGDINPVGLEILSAHDLDTIKGRKGSEVLGPERLLFYLPMAEKAKHSGRSEEFSYQIPFTNRNFVSSFIVDEDRLFISQRDVTDIKRAQQRAEEERARLQAVLDTAPVGIIIGDRSGRTVLMNKEFYKRLGR